MVLRSRLFFDVPPEDESNGLALCSLHHKTFDFGVFTLKDGVLLVSEHANGSAGRTHGFVKMGKEPLGPVELAM